MGNFQTFLSSDCFSEKYQEIVQDVKSIEEKFEKLNSSNALKLQYKNLFDNLLVKLENPQYIDVDETMTYIRKLLKKLKVYDESDISDIETAIKNLSVKVSLFLYDDDNNDSRIYLNLLKKRELQLINDCISLIDYHTKQNYNNLDPLYKSLRKTSLGSKILEKENRNLYVRENIPILSNIIENISVQALDPPLETSVPKTSARQTVNRADRNISNAKIDIHDLLQEEDDEIPVEYQNDNAQKLLKRKINKLKNDVSDHTVENPLEPPVLSKSTTELEKPTLSTPYPSVGTSHMKPPPLRATDPSLADNISQLSEDDTSTLTNDSSLYSNRHPLKKPIVRGTSVSQNSKPGYSYNQPFYDTQQMDDRMSQRAFAMDDMASRQSSFMDDDMASRQALSQRTKQLGEAKRNLYNDVKEENVQKLGRGVAKANFYDGDQISRDQSRQTQLDPYSTNRQENDVDKINQLRKKLKNAQKVLTEEKRRKRKNRNLFKKKVEDSTKNILQFKKNGKKVTPTFKQLLSTLESI